MTLTACDADMDLRALAPRERRESIFKTFSGLAAGGSVELVDDHDLRSLIDELRAAWPGRLACDDVQHGPDVWRVRLVKLAAPGDGRCCGACGGA